MGAWKGRAGTAGMLVVAALAACAGQDMAAPPAVVAAAPAGSPAPVVAPAGSPAPVVAPAPRVVHQLAVPAAPPAPSEVVDESPQLPPPPPPPPPPVFLAAGVHERQVDVDGVSRRWTIVVPAAGPASSLLVVLHGVGARGADMRSAGFEPLAAGKGVVLAYPDGMGGAWNDGRPGADPVVPGAPVDDGRFLRLLIDETVALTGAGVGRVAVVGFSNGAVMASRLACDLADRVTAIALIAGTAGQGFDRSCRPARPVAVMLAAGVNDTTVPYAGGRIANWGAKRRGYLAGVEEVFTFWRAHNGCTSTQTAGTEARGTDCRSGSPVVRYRVAGAAHEWYRAPRFDTTNVVWDFVQRRFATLS